MSDSQMSSPLVSKLASNTPVLSDEAAHKMLEQLNFFYGVSFNGMNGPYSSSRKVARVRPNVFNSVRASQDVSTEEFYPMNEADARNIHLGWPPLSALPGRPWDIMNQDTRSTTTGNWVSRRMVVHRYTVSLRVEDLEPNEEFIKEVEDALALTTRPEQIQALREVFAAWGEMCPLVAVIGGSLAATGTLATNQNLTGSATTFRPPNRGPDVMEMIDKCLDITNNFEKRFESRIRGGYPEIFSKSGFDTWLNDLMNIDNSPTWEVTKVNQVALITDFLPKELRQKIRRLYSAGNFISRSHPVGTPLPSGFDGASQGVRDIKQIKVWYSISTLQDISVVYVDGAVSGPYSFGKGKLPSDSFVLSAGEFVTEVFMWVTANTPSDITSIQFAKNTGEVSRLFGAQNGTKDPAVLSGGGDALLGLSGSFTNTNIPHLQAIWRSDVAEDKYRRIGNVTHSGYYNFTTNTFNDYEYLGNPLTARISAIRYKEGNAPVGLFQVIYSSDRNGREEDQETPVRGTDWSQNIGTWNLAKDEFINKVRVRRNATGIAMLEFYTNQGNKKKIGQETNDVEFFMEPVDKDMVLYYLMGKSAGCLNLLSFVWGVPPLAE